MFYIKSVLMLSQSSAYRFIVMIIITGAVSPFALDCSKVQHSLINLLQVGLSLALSSHRLRSMSHHFMFLELPIFLNLNLGLP